MQEMATLLTWIIADTLSWYIGTWANSRQNLSAGPKWSTSSANSRAMATCKWPKDNDSMHKIRKNLDSISFRRVLLKLIEYEKLNYIAKSLLVIMSNFMKKSEEI